MFLSIQALLIWVAPFAVGFGVVGPLTPTPWASVNALKPWAETRQTLDFKRCATAARLSEKPSRNWRAPCCIDRHQEDEKWNQTRATTRV
jgi:hypothetical protein